jgi:uncharacterized membrane protein
VALALGPALMESLKNRTLALACGALVLLWVGLFSWTQIAAARARIQAIPGSTGLDGLSWFARERPVDAAIIEFLSNEPSHSIHIIEECAINPKPSAYTLFGRIAALSGRPALCGWANHVSLFQKGVRHPDYRSKNIWDLMNEREKWTQSIYAASSLDEQTRKGLRDFGVTHVVFGELEKEQHPTLTLNALSKYGRVAFRTGDYGVVELAHEIP